MLRGQRAVRRNMAVVLPGRGAEHGPSDFLRHRMRRLHHAERAAMARAALDHVNARFRNEPQHFRRLRPHILRARMAGQMHRHAFGQWRQALRQAFFLRDIDDIFVDIEHRIGDALHVRIVRHHQCPFEFQHQPAGGRRRDDVVALVDQLREFGGHLAGLCRHFFHFGLFQERHAATTRIGGFGFNAEMVQNRAGRHAGVRLVVVHETGREDRRLALSIGGGMRVHRSRLGFIGAHESLRCEFRQRRGLIDMRDLVHQWPRQLVVCFRAPVYERRQRHGQAAIAIHFGQLPRGKIGLARFGFRHPMPQQQMRKIELERMRRHIRTLGHEAHVAQRAGFGDLGEFLAGNAVQFFGGRGVDHVEQAREAVAQIEAAPAAVTDVEHPPHLRVQLHRICEIRILPVDRMACRRVEATFA